MLHLGPLLHLGPFITFEASTLLKIIVNKFQPGDDISHERDVIQLRVSINRSIGLKIKLIDTEYRREESGLNQAKNYNY